MSDEYFNKAFFSKLADIFEKYKNKDDLSDEGIDILNYDLKSPKEWTRPSKKNQIAESKLQREKNTKHTENPKSFQDNMCFLKTKKFLGQVVIRERECDFNKLYKKILEDDFYVIYDMLFKKQEFMTDASQNSQTNMSNATNNL